MDLGHYLSLGNHFVQTNVVHNFCQTHYLKICFLITAACRIFTHFTIEVLLHSYRNYVSSGCFCFQRNSGRGEKNAKNTMDT